MRLSSGEGGYSHCIFHLGPLRVFFPFPAALLPSAHAGIFPFLPAFVEFVGGGAIFPNPMLACFPFSPSEIERNHPPKPLPPFDPSRRVSKVFHHQYSLTGVVTPYVIREGECPSAFRPRLPPSSEVLYPLFLSSLALREVREAQQFEPVLQDGNYFVHLPLPLASTGCVLPHGFCYMFKPPPTN